MKNQQTDEDITTQMERMRKHGEDMLKEEGSLLGLIEAIPSVGPHLVVPMLYSNNAEKVMIFGAMKKDFRSHQVTSLYVLTEAWLASTHKDDEEGWNRIKAYTGHLEDLPPEYRKEVMIVQYISYEEVRTTTYEFIRDADGVFIGLGDPKTISTKGNDVASLAGNLIDLLPKPEDFTHTQVH